MSFRIVPITILLAGLTACNKQVTVIPNSDPALNKPAAEFAADAAARFPFPTNLPDGGTANGRATVAYDTDLLQLINLSPEDWTGVELWVNRAYVVYIPKIDARSDSPRVKSIHFKMLYDAAGTTFPSNNDVPARFINKLEIVRNATVYQVPLFQAD